MTGIDTEHWRLLAQLMQEGSATAPLAFARFMGAFLLLPLMPMTLPRHVRMCVPIAVWPLVVAGLHLQPAAPLPPSVPVLMAWLVVEFAIGVLSTLPAALLFWAAQSAGELIDIKTGANNNAVFGGAPGSPEGPAQTLMTQLAVLAFIAGGGVQHVVSAVIATYRLLPVGRYAQVQLERLPLVAAEAGAQLFAATFHLFGPFFTVFLLIEFGIGIAGKQAQQLQVSSITAPAKGLVLPVLVLVLLAHWGWVATPAEFSVSGMAAIVRSLVAP